MFPAWDLLMSGTRNTVGHKNEVVTVKTPVLKSVIKWDVSWEKAIGDTVAEDEMVCKIETDKTSIPPMPSLTTPCWKIGIFNKPTVACPITEPGVGKEHREKRNRMWQQIAQRLKEAQNMCALLTTSSEIDLNNIQEMRVSIYALQEQLVVNAEIHYANKEVLYKDYIDNSIVVATPRGMVVPVTRNVCNMMHVSLTCDHPLISTERRSCDFLFKIQERLEDTRDLPFDL
ncbi:succinyltransferase component of 2-oxoglutarate dehydrogenase complex [Galemys pyrenaicus]|uniref:Dihydrolipoyllysine-residue succinyltransferase component of 2-oxoglutarate dehydrogenase complex, mitochondrial n=1 Tax=Galemys pyrenaicus TaxID=202257 RepID=A0A8J6DKG9_GALPY|nr:succinyltransferase component of 2-oxoglutarate dehydrogenase complex [Galemys pyrenaicus]